MHGGERGRERERTGEVFASNSCRGGGSRWRLHVNSRSMVVGGMGGGVHYPLRVDRYTPALRMRSLLHACMFVLANKRDAETSCSCKRCCSVLGRLAGPARGAYAWCALATMSSFPPAACCSCCACVQPAPAAEEATLKFGRRQTATPPPAPIPATLPVHESRRHMHSPKTGMRGRTHGLRIQRAQAGDRDQPHTDLEVMGLWNRARNAPTWAPNRVGQRPSQQAEISILMSGSASTLVYNSRSRPESEKNTLEGARCSTRPRLRNSAPWPFPQSEPSSRPRRGPESPAPCVRDG